MKIVILSETFAENMGYIQNLLPKYLALRGEEVHVISMNLAPYYQVQGAKSIYSEFLGCEELRVGSEREIDGFTLHVLDHKKQIGYMRMVGLREKLHEIHPDIVQTGAAVGWIPLDAALIKPSLGYKLFADTHYHASVFPLASTRHPMVTLQGLGCFVARAVPGYLISLATEKCYAVSVDCADVASRFFGVPERKIDICPLGVDTLLFSPIRDEDGKRKRQELRKQLGFSDNEIVCVYSGRFTVEKNPLVLAQAVEKLISNGHPYRALFVGNGPQAESIRQCKGAVVHAFVPVHELATYFRAGDIGVWPRQESMSMLDAAACGIPIVVNDTLIATERIEGNGLKYKQNDVDDLTRVLLSLASLELRRSLGTHGAEKMKNHFSWEAIADRRLRDYQNSLNGHGRSLR